VQPFHGLDNLYVDDLIIACSTKDDLGDIKLKIAPGFDVVDGKELNHFLGTEVKRNGKTQRGNWS